MEKLIDNEDFIQYRLEGKAIPICIQEQELNPYIKLFGLLNEHGLLCDSEDEYVFPAPGIFLITIPFYFYTYDTDGEIYKTRVFAEHSIMDENELCQIYIRCKANEKEYNALFNE